MALKSPREGAPGRTWRRPAVVMTTRQRLEALRLARARHHRDGSGLLAVEVGAAGDGVTRGAPVGAVVHAVSGSGRVAVGRHIDLTRGQRVPKPTRGGAARLPSVMLTLTPPVPTQPTRAGA